MTLFELVEEQQILLEMMEDPEVDPQTIADTMEGIEGEIEVKADGYAAIMTIVKGQIETVKKEEERLKARRQAMENKVETMKKTLEAAMIITGKTKFKTALHSFGIQKNPPSVVMDESYIENIPEQYLIIQEPKIDRKAILADLKAGVDLEGIAHIEQTEGLRIR